MDVIDQIAKDPDLKITVNGPRLHEFLQELSRETFQKGDLLTVGEAWGADIQRARLYSNPDGSEFSMVFQFEHIGLDQQEGKEKWDLKPLPFLKLKEILSKWQTSLYNCGWNSFFWNNHDLPRIVSRWGNDKEYWEESAKMLALLLHGMQGTPYIYQGEELGMTNVQYEITDYQDIEIRNMYRERMEMGYDEKDVMQSIYAKGRDNARTPMQWNDSKNAGFTDGNPWIKVNPNYKQINAHNQMKDTGSIFHFYKKLIQLRKDYEVLVDGKYELLLPKDPDIFAYTRENEHQKLLVICNFFENTPRMPLQEEWRDMELLLCNYDCAHNNDRYATTLRPYEARMYVKKKYETKP